MISSRLRGGFVAALLIAAAAGAGCGHKGPRVAPVGPNGVIVAFGDSLTYGTGATENESYPAVLAQLIGRKVVRAGVPGEVTAESLQRLQAVIDEHHPALVIVCLGGNDLLRRVEDVEIVANLREIVRTIKASGSSMVLVGVPRPALITSAAAFYADLAKEFDLPYDGRIVTDVLYQRDLKSDAVHPNAKGYRKMAEAIAELLRRAGAV